MSSRRELAAAQVAVITLSARVTTLSTVLGSDADFCEQHLFLISTCGERGERCACNEIKVKYMHTNSVSWAGKGNGNGKGTGSEKEERKGRGM